MPLEKGQSPLVLDLLYLLCRRFFGSDLLKCRSPLAFGLHLLCLLVPKVFWFGPFERSKPLGVRLISVQSLWILHTLLTYCFMQCVDAGRSLPFGLLRRRLHFVWGKFIALREFTMGPPRQKPHLRCGVHPMRKRVRSFYNVKRTENICEGPQSLIVSRCGLFTYLYVVLFKVVRIPRMLQLIAFGVGQLI